MTGVLSTSSLFPGGGSFKIDGVHSDYFGMFYKNWAYDVVPSIRSALIDIPGRRGKTDQGSEISSRLLTLDLEVVSTDAPTRWVYMSRWAAALNPETGPHTIELCDERPGWMLYVQPAGGAASPALITASWTQSLEAADPHWYETTSPTPIQSWTFGPGAAGFGTIFNRGNTYAEPMYYLAPVDGSHVLTNPTFFVNSQACSLAGVLHYGENWSVDVAHKTVTRNGVSDITNWSGTFPVLPGTQAGFDAGGQGYLIELVDGAGAGGYIQATVAARLL